MVPAAAVRKFSIFYSNYVYVGTFCACSTGMNHKFQLFGLNFGCNKEIWPRLPKHKHFIPQFVHFHHRTNLVASSKKLSKNN